MCQNLPLSRHSSIATARAALIRDQFGSWDCCTPALSHPDRLLMLVKGKYLPPTYTQHTRTPNVSKFLVPYSLDSRATTWTSRQAQKGGTGQPLPNGRSYLLLVRWRLRLLCQEFEHVIGPLEHTRFVLVEAPRCGSVGSHRDHACSVSTVLLERLPSLHLCIHTMQP